jgi:hypothetical protein
MASYNEGQIMGREEESKISKIFYDVFMTREGVYKAQIFENIL